MNEYKHPADVDIIAYREAYQEEMERLKDRRKKEYKQLIRRQYDPREWRKRMPLIPFVTQRMFWRAVRKWMGQGIRRWWFNVRWLERISQTVKKQTRKEKEKDDAPATKI